ncbi:MAG: hypothetical protein KGI53_00300 [Nitrospirota bacterium]|nr:hypothetical protein [Nitrospirota bacterium]
MNRSLLRQTGLAALRTFAVALGLAVTLGWHETAWADQAAHEGHESAPQHEGHVDAPAQQEPAAMDHSAHQAAASEHSRADNHDGHDMHATATIVRGGVTREEEKAYSLFMHRSCGIIVALLGLLVLTDRLTQRRHGALRKGMGAIWLLMGVHIFLNADPTDWPLAATFMESYNRPGSSEWLQHKVLCLIPVAIGLYTMFVARRERPNPVAGYAMAAVLAFGGIALLYHEHEHSPGMDMGLIVRQHNLMAVTSIFIAAGWLADTLDRLAWKPKFVMVPVGLILLGLELAIYTE